MSNERNIEQEEFIKTFATIMSGMIEGEPKHRTIEDIKMIEGKTGVIVTPFNEVDELDLELAGEFYLIVLNSFLKDEKIFKFGFQDISTVRVDSILENLDNIIETNIKGMSYVEGIAKEGLYKILKKDYLDDEGKMKWKELHVGNGKKVSFSIKKYGIEYVINDLNQNKINVINQITSDYFNISYF